MGPRNASSARGVGTKCMQTGLDKESRTGICFTWPQVNNSDNLFNLKYLLERTALKGMKSN